jgi:hypothetical protein
MRLTARGRRLVLFLVLLAAFLFGLVFPYAYIGR